MRKYIKIVEKLSAPPLSLEILDEISVISRLGVNPEINNLIQGATYIEGDIWGKDYDPDFLYFIGNPVESYCVVRNREGRMTLMELVTEKDKRYQGLAGKLIKFICKKYHNVFIDDNLSIDSIQMFEKLIANKKINASIFDRKTGELTTYNPDMISHKKHPMYDMVIQGIDRPIVSKDEQYRFGWVIHEGYVRDGILSPYIRKL